MIYIYTLTLTHTHINFYLLICVELERRWAQMIFIEIFMNFSVVFTTELILIVMLMSFCVFDMEIIFNIHYLKIRQ